MNDSHAFRSPHAASFSGYTLPLTAVLESSWHGLHGSHGFGLRWTFFFFSLFYLSYPCQNIKVSSNLFFCIQFDFYFFIYICFVFLFYSSILSIIIWFHIVYKSDLYIIPHFFDYFLLAFFLIEFCSKFFHLIFCWLRILLHYFFRLMF